MEILVLTVPGRPYLGALLDEIDRQAPGRRKTLYYDGINIDRVKRDPAADNVLYFESRPGWYVIGSAKVSGNNSSAYFRAFRETEGDVLFLEDDVFPKNHAIRNVEQVGAPGVAAVSHFDVLFRNGTPGGLYLGDAGLFGHSQAVYYPWHTVKTLLKWQESKWNLFDPQKGADEMVARALRGSQIGYWVPNYFQHVGEVSVARPERQGIPTSQTFSMKG